MNRMFLNIEKAKKTLWINRKLANFKKKRAATGREMKSGKLLGHLAKFFDPWQEISKQPNSAATLPLHWPLLYPEEKGQNYSIINWTSPACDIDTVILRYLTYTSHWYHFHIFPKRMERYILDFPCVWSRHYDLRISYLRLPLLLLLFCLQTNGALHPGLLQHVTLTLWS